MIKKLCQFVFMVGLVVGVAAALAAWDLDGFADHLAHFEPRADQAQLVKNHLGRLLGVLGLGVILGEAALSFRLALGLELVAVLGVVSVMILLQGVRLLGSETEEQVKKEDNGVQIPFDKLLGDAGGTMADNIVIDTNFCVVMILIFNRFYL